MQRFTLLRCHLLCRELVCAHRDAVDKLHGTPQAVKLHALVNVHDTIGGRRPTPHPIVQETADACQNDLKHGKAAAKTLFGEQVPLTRNGNLLAEKRMDATLIYATQILFRLSVNICKKYLRRMDLSSAVWFSCLSVIP